MSIIQTEIAIKQIKDCFEKTLANNLNLTRVSAPLFVLANCGLNDDLNGIERPVKFDMKDIQNQEIEIIHSLAKWKRVALKNYGFHVGEGLYADMNAIRRDEDLDNLHSIYVDQWDWEVIISKEQRTIETLYEVIEKIYDSFKKTEDYITALYPQLDKILPDNITFISSQQLLEQYPDLNPKQREDAICKKHGAVFVTQVGGSLTNGEKHDNRAPDYDDWSLNGDLLFWYPLLNRAVEYSSMGIRVDETTIQEQLKQSGCEQRLTHDYHQSIINKQLPYTIGGGLGQSRICMFFLGMAHIGQVQAAIWPKEMIKMCEQANINLL